MANETFHADYELVLVKVETTYGTDAAPSTSADRLYVEDFSMKFSSGHRQRKGRTPGRKGLKGTKGRKTTSVAGACFLSDLTVASAASLPVENAILEMCGLSPTYSATYTDPIDGATSDKAQVFAPNELAPGSSTIWGYRYTEAGDVEIDKARGTRADWELLISEGEPWLFKWNGEGKDPAERVDGGTGGLPTGESYPTDDPEIGGGCTIVLVERGADTVYGGGTEGTPTMDAIVLSASFKGNNGVQPKGGIAASNNGPSKVKLRQADHVTAELVLEAVHADDFDPATYRDNLTALHMVIRSPEPASGVDTIQLNGTWIIVDFTTGDVDGDLAWTMQLESVYPESSGDGGGLAVTPNVFEIAYRTGA